jgi:hypothetical protein
MTDRVVEKLEEYLKEKILPDLEGSRGGFDKIHTLEVVDWLKQIINHNPKLKLLNDDFFSFLSNKQKIRCVHLVAVHDKKFEIKDTDELILMEADMLSSLDITDKPTYDAESNKKLMKSMLTTRIPKFITKFSKNEAKKLIRKRVDYYKKIASTQHDSPNKNL